MVAKQHLGNADYAVIGISLLIPLLIGLKFRFSGGRQNSTDEYFLAGKNASMFPVIMSISVTILSAAAIIGLPAEVYRFGSQFVLVAFSTGVGMFLSSRIFLPVYFNCNVSSIYEFLEMRFGKFTKYTVSGMFIIQMVLYTSTVLLGPVLALSAVTDFSLNIMVIICGAVCTIYCFMGGIKAILWTDAFQGILMFLCLSTMYLVGMREVGGPAVIYDRAKAGDRWEFFNMNFDFTTRFTFWNSTFRGLVLGLAFYGTNQIQVQRTLTMKSYQRAQIALQCSILLVVTLLFACTMFGVILYAVYFHCDPILMQSETGISKYDQLVPYFIVTRLHSIPGLTGLCFAGIFSGSLSTISSALNSLSTVTLVDFVQPLFADKLNPTWELYIAKGSCLIYGIATIFLTITITNVDSLAQATIVFLSVAEGPVLAVFMIGVLTRKTSDKSTVISLIASVTFICWICFGSLFSGYKNPSLPLDTSQCPNTNSTILFETSTTACVDENNCALIEPTELE
ncbi:sodium-coupled monocarboxylate transporter 1-like isoform X2 [Argiope bruennichi]|uniref:sodium-coupled monocarboxylate transporter 1-like isoform X2 n=1 Tax=Argiope bruennichi TaxID=94029 RepID=UPI002494D088|nr:sodium-coupled monocarboxylate transporter 1-like isoform X2 [Argiope bruennichi]